MHKVWKNGNGITVALNTGNGFDEPISWKGANALSESAPITATVLIIRTVLIVRATTAKMATVRSVLATIMRVVTVLIVHASIRVVEDLADTATETAIAVQSVVRPIMTPMLSTARRNR